MRSKSDRFLLVGGGKHSGRKVDIMVSGFKTRLDGYYQMDMATIPGEGQQNNQPDHGI